MCFVIATAVYPGMEEYFSDFITSLTSQSDRDFLLVVADDGMEELDAYLEEFEGDCYVSQVIGTPVQVRKEMIGMALDMNASQIMFLDSDDRAAPNRVECVKESLKSSNIVFNDLVFFGESIEAGNRSILSSRYKHGVRHGISNLLHSNHLGMSNTAVSSKCLETQYRRPPDHVIAYDWLLFSLLLLEGESAYYDGRTYTEYRQHGENVANMVARSDTDIIRGIKVKSDHYSYLVDHYPEFSELAETFSRLATRIDKNDSFADLYLYWMSSQKFENMPLWWEIIKVPEDLNYEA